MGCLPAALTHLLILTTDLQQGTGRLLVHIAWTKREGSKQNKTGLQPWETGLDNRISALQVEMSENAIYVLEQQLGINAQLLCWFLLSTVTFECKCA